MGKHNLRRIVNLQKWEKSVTGIPATENQENKGCPKEQSKGKASTSLNTIPCLSPEVLKRDLEQLEQLKYRKLK